MDKTPHNKGGERRKKGRTPEKGSSEQLKEDEGRRGVVEKLASSRLVPI